MVERRSTDYTNGELGLILKEMQKDIADRHKENSEHLIEIKTEVRNTNGRVRKLELWRMFLIGAWAVLSMATPVAWYLILHSLENFSNQVDTKIVNAINANNERFFEK